MKKITKKEFKELIGLMENAEQFQREMYREKKPIYLRDHTILVEKLLELYFGEEAMEWIGWFCFDNDFGKGTLSATDAHQNPICQDVDGLWEYLTENDYL